MKKTSPPARGRSRPPASRSEASSQAGSTSDPASDQNLQADPIELERQLAAINATLSALERLLALLPPFPALGQVPPGQTLASAEELRALQALWTEVSPAFCESMAAAIEGHRDLFEPLPFSGATVRGQLQLCGRLDTLLRRVEQALPVLSESLLRQRGALMTWCTAALVQGEVPLQKPFLPAADRRLIEQVTGPARLLLTAGMEARAAGAENAGGHCVSPGSGSGSEEEALMALEVGYELIGGAEEELADALLRKLSRRRRQARTTRPPRKPN
jgi:hypothetical protein